MAEQEDGPDAFVVEVKEGMLEATQQGIDWWNLFAQRFRETDRLRYTTPPMIIGGVVEVACGSEGDAVWLADQMVVIHGLPRSAVRVKRASPAGTP